MADITVSNKEWAIIGAVDTALTAVTIGSTLVFSSVTVTTSDTQAEECQFDRHPVCIIRYIGTEEDASVDETRNCLLSAEIIIATKVDRTDARDEAARLQEILRLVNAVKNAVEGITLAAGSNTLRDAATPAATDDNWHQYQLVWGSPEIDTETHDPWAVARLPVEITFGLSSPTAH